MSRMNRYDKNYKEPQHNEGKNKKKKGKRNIGLKAFIGLLGFLVLALAGGTVYIAYLSTTLPTWTDDSFEIAKSSEIYDMYGTAIGSESIINHTPITYEEIPQSFVNALVATEDANFYEHKGFSIGGIARSLVANIFSGSKSQGGSTITQQLARGIFLSDEALTKSYSRKMKEILLAMQIEDRLTKEEIFTHYANTTYFGHGAYGLEAAAKTYFNVSARDLTDAQAAMLAGMPQAPSGYDPYVYVEDTYTRRNDVADRMVEVGYITAEKAAEIKNDPIVLDDSYAISVTPENDTSITGFKYFKDAVSIQAENIIQEQGLESIYRGGYKIYSTMDPNVQTPMEEVFSNPNNFPDAMNDVDPEAAMVVIDHTTGQIRGMVGGREYLVEKGFNRALNGQRQPGSCFKPIAVYGPAFEQGASAPSMIYNDSPTPAVYDGSGNEYPLVNYDGSFGGNMNVRTAVSRSINTIAVRILNDIGPSTGYEFAKRIGITSLTEHERSNLSLALGGLEQGVSPLEMARAYGVFANEGELVENTMITRIDDSYGNPIYEAEPQRNVVISPEVAYMTTSVLEGVVNNGTGTGAMIYNSPVEVAGKTGSTDMVDASGNVIYNGNKDLWFVGYTPELTGAVWIGYDESDENHYLSRNISSNICAQIWSKVIGSVSAEKMEFTRPANIVDNNIDTTTGLPTDKNTGVTDIFIKSLLPSHASNSINTTPGPTKPEPSNETNNTGTSTEEATGGYATDGGGGVQLAWIGPDTTYTIVRVDSNGNSMTLGDTNTTSFIDTSPVGRPSTYYVKYGDKELKISYE